MLGRPRGVLGRLGWLGRLERLGLARVLAMEVLERLGRLGRLELARVLAMEVLEVLGEGEVVVLTRPTPPVLQARQPMVVVVAMATATPSGILWVTQRPRPNP